MHFSILLIAGALAAGVFASPTLKYAIHEKRSSPPHQWSKESRASRHQILPMRIALTETNIDRGMEFLDEVSTPGSPKYGQHWTSKQVADMFAASEESITVVKSWLSDHGIDDTRVKLSNSKSWLSFNASVKEVEDLIKTEYFIHRHIDTSQREIATYSYSVPQHIRKHVDFIVPTVHFDMKIKPREPSSTSINKRDNEELSVTKSTPPVITGAGRNIGKTWGGELPKLGESANSVDFQGVASQLANCSRYIVPNCLRVLYQFYNRGPANPQNSYGIVEYTPQSYLPSDLDKFFRMFSQQLVGDRPILDSIDGGALQTFNESFGYNGESDLDLEYAMTLVYPQQVTLYQVGDFVEGASFNNFLDAIDATYCTCPSWGYKGPENCGTYAATKVISTSYAYNEADLTPFYEQRQCNEYMKLGMMGVSVLYSSGDYGVAGNGGQCINPVTGNYTNGTYGKFNPSFPGTCPYVTAVGATQVKNHTNIVQALASHTQPEMACETVIYSGGGFSNVFPLPGYQAAAVRNWFARYPPPYGADRFNNSQMTRAIPDVSANGANYVIAIDGNFSLVYGTSASTPTFGSVLTLINQALLNANKPTLGFINPALYAHPEVMNDITEGGNQGCGTPGFMSAPGWDPVTGLGTPNFPKMVRLFLALAGVPGYENGGNGNGGYREQEGGWGNDRWNGDDDWNGGRGGGHD